LAFFTTPGCKECRAAALMIERLGQTYTGLQVATYSIQTVEGMRYSEALADKFGMSARNRGVTPAVFMAHGYLAGDDVHRDALWELAARSVMEPERDDWRNVTEQELASASAAVEKRGTSYTLPVVLWAGIVDGVNPCAFATMIFLLSYLRVRKRRGREMLRIGGAYVAAVFGTYFAIGLGLSRILEKLTVLDTASRALNWAMAGAMLIVAWLSFRDGIRCLRGRAAEMTLQLPDAAKQRIHAAVRHGTAARHYVLAAVVLGVVVSVLELACTGQVYAPTIMYMIQSGAAQAKGTALLAAYNVAFVLPLVVVFAVSAAGTESSRLQQFMGRHMALAKFILSVFFITLFVLFIRYALF
jgi:cytochrome c biogenesis protein CcdA